MVLGAPWWTGNLNTDQVFSDFPLLPLHRMHLRIITVFSGVSAPKVQPSCLALLQCQGCVPASVSVCVRVCV